MESLTSALQTASSESVREALRAGAELLHKAGIDSARLDVEVLLRHVLGVKTAELYLDFDMVLNAAAEREFKKLLLRRAGREPVAYITSHREFWSLDFVVTPEVLIPRPETELLVERALKLATRLPAMSALNILDLGTGSGAIAVSLAKELPQARISAVDISAVAIEIACLNARRHGVEDRVEFFCGDLFEPVTEEREGYDLIVANPPYIRNGDLAGLAPEIREWEPIMALDGGADGLFCYRRIVAAAGDYLKAGGSILLELGNAMGEAVARLFADAGGFEPAQVYRDYAGNERVIAAAKLLPAVNTREGPDRG
jgi:release factor glutamine methyltransferase